MSNIFIANFLTCISSAKLKNLNRTTRQQLLLPPPLNSPALLTVFEISRQSVHCCCSTVATLIQWPGSRRQQRGKLVRYQTRARGFYIVKSM